MATAAINISTATTTIIKTPDAGTKLIIDGITLLCTGAQTITFVGGSTNLSGAMAFPANGGMVGIDCGFELLVTEAFKIITGAGVQVSGWVKYRQVPV